MNIPGICHTVFNCSVLSKWIGIRPEMIGSDIWQNMLFKAINIFVVAIVSTVRNLKLNKGDFYSHS